MTIAVYGDSFADSCNNKLAWPNILKKILHTEIKNFALSGSSVVYSYDLFLKNFQQYKTNIFVVSHANRYSWFDKNSHIWTTRISGLTETISYNKEYYNYKLNANDKRIYKNKVLEIATYPSNQIIYIKSMIDSIKYNDPNAIVIHAFNEFTDSNLKNIQSLDYYYHFEDKNTVDQSVEANGRLRPCHMSLQQNKEFAGYLAQHIQNEIEIDTIIHKDNVEKYFSVTKDFSQSGINDG